MGIGNRRLLAPGAADIYGISGGAVAGLGGGQIQPFVISSSADSATVTLSPAVDLNESILIWGGFNVANVNSGRPDDDLLRIDLTNATTVTVAQQGSESSIVRGSVIEFPAGTFKSIQQGTIIIGASAASNTATISSVDVATPKAFDIFLGQVLQPGASENEGEHAYANIILTNATTVTATRATAPTAKTLTVNFMVAEFN